MNGFEPLRRRIIDYTEAGQWSVVYDGPLEECESEKLKAENAKLRELLTIASEMARDYDGDRRLLRQLVQEIYEDQCDECDQWKYRDRMRELGIKVD